MQTPPILTDPGLEPAALEHLRTYFAGYSGRHFNTLGTAAGEASRNRVTAEDLVALTMLSVQFSGQGAAWLLVAKQDEVSGLLAGIPDDVDLWEPGAGAHLDDGQPAARLWSLVDSAHSFGPVATSKLLARKRPRLIPVYDAAIRVAFDGGVNQQWRYWPGELLTPELVARLRAWHAAAGLDDRIPLLRVLDVVVWMEYREQARSAGGRHRARG